MLRAIDRDRYRVIPVGITRDGVFVLEDDDPDKFALDAARLPEVVDNGTRILWPEGGSDRTLRVRRADGSVDELGDVDVVLPILHGVHGEDGTVQGFFDTLGVPYAGGGVLDSALCMDKHFMKIVLQAAGVPVSPWVTVTRARWERDPEGVRADAATLGEPVFVKPARAGSSVGVSKVHDASELAAALELAFDEDEKVLIETAIVGPRGRGRDPRGPRRRRTPGVAARRDRADDPGVLRLRGQVPRRRRRGRRVPGRSLGQ